MLALYFNNQLKHIYYNRQLTTLSFPWKKVFFQHINFLQSGVIVNNKSCTSMIFLSYTWIRMAEKLRMI